MADEKRLRQRSEIEDRYKWNIEDMYADEDDWEADFSAALKMADGFTAQESWAKAQKHCSAHSARVTICGRRQSASTFTPT